MFLPHFTICSFFEKHCWVLALWLKEMIHLPPSTLLYLLVNLYKLRGWRQEGFLCSLSSGNSLSTQWLSWERAAQLPVSPATEMWLTLSCRWRILELGHSTYLGGVLQTLWNETCQFGQGCATHCVRSPLLEAGGKLNLSANDTVGHAFHFLQPLFFANLGWSQGLRQSGLHWEY